MNFVTIIVWHQLQADASNAEDFNGGNALITFCTKIMLCVPCLAAQLCLTLCNPVDCSPPGSSVHRDSPGSSLTSFFEGNKYT